MSLLLSETPIRSYLLRQSGKHDFKRRESLKPKELMKIGISAWVTPAGSQRSLAPSRAAAQNPAGLFGLGGAEFKGVGFGVPYYRFPIKASFEGPIYIR